jgi:hypothetical protein
MQCSTVISTQDGLITRQQALGTGMTASSLRHAIRPDGPWQRVLPGVYATFTGPLTSRHLLRALVLRAGPHASISGAPACRAYGLRYLPEGSPTVVLVPASHRVTLPEAVVVVRTRRLPRAIERRGLPLAPIDRAVLDACAANQVLRDVRALMCESVQRGLTTVDRLAAELTAAPVRNSRLPRRTLRDLELGARSAPECELLDLLATSRVLPPAMHNVPLPDLPDVIGDAWWWQARLVVEIDSVEHHQLGLGPATTQRRHARLAAAGWTVLPISPQRLRDDPTGVLREIEAAYRMALLRIR